MDNKTEDQKCRDMLIQIQQYFKELEEETKAEEAYLDALMKEQMGEKKDD